MSEENRGWLKWMLRKSHNANRCCGAVDAQGGPVIRRDADEGRGKSMLQHAPMYAYIPVRHMARARRFYEQVLGFTPRSERDGGVVYAFADHTACFMYQTPNAGTSQASQAFWQVDDIEREVAELKAKGVTFEEYDMPGMKTVNSIFTGGGARAAWFKDSEGNILAVIQNMPE
jgi:predicted enzyme related to lactoylglutathione lyase